MINILSLQLLDSMNLHLLNMENFVENTKKVVPVIFAGICCVL